VRAPDGEIHRTERPVSAVCRCGKSASLPWCDATHQAIRTRFDDEGESHE
jgi:CDGSH-type Zn-finger protein